MKHPAATFAAFGILLPILTGPGPSLAWDLAVLDGDPGFVAPHVAVAVDQVTGLTDIAYHFWGGDDTQLLAMEDGSPGNCGPGSSFQCGLTGGRGPHSSNAVYSDGAGTHHLTSFHNPDTNAVQFQDYFLTHDGSPGSYSEVVTIESGGMGIDRGLYTSLELDSNHQPHIAYQVTVGVGDEALKYARYVGSGNGNCGEGDALSSWQCETVDSGEGIGQFASLALTSDDRPVIAYRDSTNGYPKIAVLYGTSWSINEIQRTGKDTGWGVSLDLDSNDAPHIAYYNDTDETMEYATRVPPTQGNCSNTTWQCDAIEGVGGGAEGLAIAVSGDDYPIIAFQASSGFELRVARPVESMPGFESNCGPEDIGWVCRSFDFGTNCEYPGESVNMAVRRSGDVVLAYHCAEDTTADVIVAFEAGWPIFTDGFELGDSSRWSLIAP